MKLINTTDWQEPLLLAKAAEKISADMVFLYSGFMSKHSGRYSILALHKIDAVKTNLAKLEQKLSDNKDKYENCWFGYLSYDLKNQLEKLPKEKPNQIKYPKLIMAKFALIIEFDHKSKTIKTYIDETHKKAAVTTWETIKKSISEYSKTKNNNLEIPLSAIELCSNMSKQEYLSKVGVIKSAILDGKLYQANLTRKFYGNSKTKINGFNIFEKLCSLSPSTYSAFIKFDDLNIISSSPECFLTINKEGTVTTRPIKGSAARNSNKKLDQELITKFKNSIKDRAENLMIVDLSRNDLAKSCDVGSVKVHELFTIETYKTIHHMVSTITAKKAKTKNFHSSTLDVIKGCFPPGSMTGAPKIAAMKLCSKLEKYQRGIYSGAIGWFGGDGSADLSVVIRTIITRDKYFEFQTGGAIVYDSVPINEYKETLLKAKAIAKVLGITKKQLEEARPTQHNAGRSFS